MVSDLIIDNQIKSNQIKYIFVPSQKHRKYHILNAAHGMEGVGATGEDTVHKRTGIVITYLLQWTEDSPG